MSLKSPNRRFLVMFVGLYLNTARPWWTNVLTTKTRIGEAAQEAVGETLQDCSAGLKL
jgi:hypothetical protein